MTESLPQPGDNPTPDATAAPEPSAPAAPDQGDTNNGVAQPYPSDNTGKSNALDSPANRSGGGDGGGGGGDNNATAEKPVTLKEEEEHGEEHEDEDQDDQDEEEEEEDEEDEEPKLKYARLTQHLGSVYRNGDATSAFLVAGDKMVRNPPTQNIVFGLSLFANLLADRRDSQRKHRKPHSAPPSLIAY